MMNFSEYTLVSFGDSFTFGQDLVPKYSTDHKDLRPIQEQYKKDCNNLSYTKILADKLRFKDSLNFGVLGGSNDRALMLLETFLRLNPTLKVFVLFNFTSASRFMIFSRLMNPKQGYYKCIDIMPDSYSYMEGKYTGINKKSIEQQYTHYRNSIQDVYNHVKDRRMIYHMLSKYNVPYVTFDGINDMDDRILRDNPTQYIQMGRDGMMDCMENDDERYVFKELDFIKSYCKELVDKSSLLAHIDLPIDKNFEFYLSRRGRDLYDDCEHYVSEHGRHWNVEGHSEVSKVIHDFINERYK